MLGGQEFGERKLFLPLQIRDLRDRKGAGIVFVLVVGRSVRTVREGEETSEAEIVPAGAENVTRALGLDQNGIEHGGRHLAGDEALPDQFVETVLVGRKDLAHRFRGDRNVRGTDRLVGVLRVCFRAVDARRFGQIIGTELIADQRKSRLLRDARHAERVGTHIGNQTLHAAELGTEIDAFVKFLRDLHDPTGLEAEFLRRFLLHRRGREGGGGLLDLLRALDREDGELPRSHGVGDLLRVRLACKRRFRLAAAEETGVEFFSVLRLERDVDRPVFLGNETVDLVFPVDDQTGRDRLDAPGGKTALDVLPKKRTQFITDDPVEDAARLLGVHQIQIDFSRRFDRRFDCVFGNFVETDAARLVFRDAERLRQVPGDRLSLPVGVGRKKDLAGVLRLFFELTDHVALAADVDIMGLEMIVDVDAERTLGEVADVSDRRDDLISGAEIALDRQCFCRGFHDNEICHVHIPDAIRVLSFVLSEKRTK